MASLKRLVTSKVFEGGEGCVRGGMLESERERGVWVPPDLGLAEGEMRGKVWAATMLGRVWVVLNRTAGLRNS